MSIVDTFKADIGDIGAFLVKLKDDVIKAKNIWVAISSPQTRAFIATLTKDVLNIVKDAPAAVEAKGLNFTLDEQVYADAKQLIADAKAGDGVIKTDLALLGITL